MSFCQSRDIEVLVVDDREITRYYLKLILSEQNYIRSVSLASNGREAIELARSIAPDVIILDLNMPIMSGWVAAPQLKKILPQCKIIAYSSWQKNHPELPDAIDCFCHKDSPIENLLNQLSQAKQEVRI